MMEVLSQPSEAAGSPFGKFHRQRGKFRLVGIESRGPRAAKLFPSLSDAGLKMFVHASGQEILHPRAAVIAFRQPDFFFAERLAVGRMAVLLVRGAQPMWLSQR